MYKPPFTEELDHQPVKEIRTRVLNEFSLRAPSEIVKLNFVDKSLPVPSNLGATAQEPSSYVQDRNYPSVLKDQKKRHDKDKTPLAIWEPMIDCSIKGITKTPEMASHRIPPSNVHVFGSSFPNSEISFGDHTHKFESRSQNVFHKGAKRYLYNKDGTQNKNKINQFTYDLNDQISNHKTRDLHGKTNYRRPVENFDSGVMTVTIESNRNGLAENKFVPEHSADVVNDLHADGGVLDDIGHMTKMTIPAETAVTPRLIDPCGNSGHPSDTHVTHEGSSLRMKEVSTPTSGKNSAKDIPFHSLTNIGNEVPEPHICQGFEKDDEKIKRKFAGHIDKTDYAFPITRWKKTTKGDEDPSTTQPENSPLHKRLKSSKISDKKRSSVSEAPAPKVRHYDQTEIRKFITDQRAKRKALRGEEQSRREQKEKEYQKRLKQLHYGITSTDGVSSLQHSSHVKSKEKSPPKMNKEKPCKAVQANLGQNNDEQSRETYLMSRLISEGTVIEKPLSTAENISYFIAKTLERCEKEVQLAKSSSSSLSSRKSPTSLKGSNDYNRLAHTHHVWKAGGSKPIQNEGSCRKRNFGCSSTLEFPSGRENFQPLSHTPNSSIGNFSVEELKTKLTAAIRDNSEIYQSLQLSSHKGSRFTDKSSSQGDLSVKRHSKDQEVVSLTSHSKETNAQKNKEYPDLCLEYTYKLQVPPLPKFHLRSFEQESQNRDNPQAILRSFTPAEKSAALKIQSFYRGFRVRKVTKHLLSSKAMSTILNPRKEYQESSTDDFKAYRHSHAKRELVRGSKSIHSRIGGKTVNIPEYIKPFVMLSATGDVSTFINSYPMDNLELSSKSHSEGNKREDQLPPNLPLMDFHQNLENYDRITSRFKVPLVPIVEKLDKETSMTSLLQDRLDNLTKDEITQTSLRLEPHSIPSFVRNFHQSEKQDVAIQATVSKKTSKNPGKDLKQNQALISDQSSAGQDNRRLCHSNKEHAPIYQDDPENHALGMSNFTDLLQFKKSRKNPTINCALEMNEERLTNFDQDAEGYFKESDALFSEVPSISSKSTDKVKNSQNDFVDLLNFRKEARKIPASDMTSMLQEENAQKNPQFVQDNNYLYRSTQKSKDQIKSSNGPIPTTSFPNYPYFAPADLKSRITAELQRHDVMGNALNHLKDLETLQEMSKVHESQHYFENALQSSQLKSQEIANELEELKRDFSRSQQQSANRRDLEGIIEGAQQRISQLEIDTQERTEIHINRAAQRLYKTLVEGGASLPLSPAQGEEEGLPIHPKSGSPSVRNYSSNFSSTSNDAASSAQGIHGEASVEESTDYSLEERPSQGMIQEDIPYEPRPYADPNATCSSIPSEVHESFQTSSVAEEISNQMSNISDDEKSIQTDVNISTHGIPSSLSLLQKGNINQNAITKKGRNKDAFPSTKYNQRGNSGIVLPKATTAFHQVSLKEEKHVSSSKDDKEEHQKPEYEDQQSELTGYSESFEPDSSLSDASESVQSVKQSLCADDKEDEEHESRNLNSIQDPKDFQTLPTITNKLLTLPPSHKVAFPTSEGHLALHPPRNAKGALHSTLALMESIQKEEEVRFSQQRELLKVHERSLKEEARQKAATLKTEGGPNVRKKLRAIEIQLREQLSHINRLIETQNLAVQQKRLIYMHHHLLLSSTANPSTSLSPFKLLTSRVASPITSRMMDSLSSSDATENFSLSNPLSLRDSPGVVCSNDNSDEDVPDLKVPPHEDKETRERRSPNFADANNFNKFAYKETKQPTTKEKERLSCKDDKTWKRREKKPTAQAPAFHYVKEDMSLSTESITEESIVASSHESQSSVIEDVTTEGITDGKECSISFPKTSVISEKIAPSSEVNTTTHFSQKSEEDCRISSLKEFDPDAKSTIATESQLQEGSKTSSSSSIPRPKTVSKSLTFENTFEKSSSDSELGSKRSFKSEVPPTSKKEGAPSSIPFPLRVPLSPRSIRQPRRYSSESDDSFTHSQNETASDISDSEGKLAALRGELAARKGVFVMLKKEKKRARMERIASQEQALVKKIADYDALIKEAKQELEKEKRAQETQTVVAVKPLIKRPQVAENRRLSKPDQFTTLEKTDILDETSLIDMSVESIEMEKHDSDGSSLYSLDSKKDEDEPHEQDSNRSPSICGSNLADDSNFNISGTKTEFNPNQAFIADKDQGANDSTSISEECPSGSMQSDPSVIKTNKKLQTEVEESEQSFSQGSSTETIVQSPKKSNSILSGQDSPDLKQTSTETKSHLTANLAPPPKLEDDSSSNNTCDEGELIEKALTEEISEEILSSKPSESNGVSDPKGKSKGAESFTEEILNQALDDSFECVIGIYANKEKKSKQIAEKLELRAEDQDDMNATSPPVKEDTPKSSLEGYKSETMPTLGKRPGVMEESRPLGDLSSAASRDKEDCLPLNSLKDISADGTSPDSEISSASLDKSAVDRAKSPISSVQMMNDDLEEASSPPNEENSKLDTNELLSRLMSVQAASDNRFNEDEESQANEEFTVGSYEGSWFDDEFLGSGKPYNIEEEFLSAEMARLEEIKKFQERHPNIVLREVPNKPPPPYTPPPSMEVALQVSPEENVSVAKVVATSEVSTVSLPHPQTADNTISVPHDLSKADLRKLFSEITNIIPTKEEDILNCVQSHIEIIYEHMRSGHSPETLEPPQEFALCTPSNFDEDQEYEASCSQIFNHLLFDLTKELSSEIYSIQNCLQKPIWNASAFSSFIKIGKKYPRLSKKDLSSAVQKKVRVCMNWDQSMMRESSIIKWAKIGMGAVDQFLVRELQLEEYNWTDYSDDEVLVKDKLSEEIFSSILDDTISIFMRILAKRNN